MDDVTDMDDVTELVWEELTTKLTTTREEAARKDAPAFMAKIPGGWLVYASPDVGLPAGLTFVPRAREGSY